MTMRRLIHWTLVLYMGTALVFVSTVQAALTVEEFLTGGTRYGELITRTGTQMKIRPPSFAGGAPGIIAGIGIAVIMAAYENNAPGAKILPGSGVLPDQNNFPAPPGWSDNQSPDGTMPYSIPSGVPSPGATITTSSAINSTNPPFGQSAFYGNRIAYHRCGFPGSGQVMPADWSGIAGYYQSGGGSCSEGSSTSYIYSVPIYCPSGYTYNSTNKNCKLSASNSVKWPSDGIPTLQPTPFGNSFVNYARDPDVMTLPSTGGFTSQGFNEVGNPTQTVFTPTSTGGVSVVEFTERTVDGVPQVADVRVETDNQGNIITYSSTITNNTTINNYNPSVPPPNPTTTPTTPTTTNIELPTDYSRENTLKSIETKVTVETDPSPEIETKYQDFIAGIPKTPQEAGVTDFDSSSQSSLLPEVYSSMPDGGNCVDPNLTVLGHTVQIELCRYWVPWRDGIGWAMWVAVSIYCYRRVAGLEFG